MFWFRRDLRLDDNVGLYHALDNETNVLPIFIFDSDILSRLPKEDSRVYFLHQRIEDLNKELGKSKKKIHVFHGKPVDVFRKILKSNSVHAVYTNRDYEPYATKRDAEIKALFSKNGVSFSTFKDHVIFEQDEVVKSDGTPYRVYTPYSRAWLNKFEQQGHLKDHHIEDFEKLTTIPNHSNPSLSEIGFKTSKILVPQYNTSQQIIDQYEAMRNTPSVAGTSKIGVHLRFGTLSIRKAVTKALDSYESNIFKGIDLARVFYANTYGISHILKTKASNLNTIESNGATIQKNSRRWCNGETGYPFVDAGMRELNQTGFMHNRVRMLVGSFLCKHLLIDWRLGEAYFAEKLLDYEMASNVGNWQWVAGCGVDAAPYFRIFNPTEQIKKFDKDHIYIKKWVPDYQTSSYPQPIVDHKMARERCLETYKSALNK